jgi:hypothetical protein
MSIKTIKVIPNPDDEILEIPKFLRDLAKRDKKESKQGKGLNSISEAPKIVVPSLPMSPKQEKKKRQQELMSFLASLVDTDLKKKPLIAKMRDKFPKLSSSQICRFVNNQLKLKVIAIDTKYKTKPVIIKGKYWRVL